MYGVSWVCDLEGIQMKIKQHLLDDCTPAFVSSPKHRRSIAAGISHCSFHDRPQCRKLR